jgi:hypothetical protein
MFEYSFYQNKIQHLVYVRAESRFFYHLHPCSCSSLSDTMFMFERSREPRATRLLVYVRAESRTFFVRQAESRTLTPCLCSSGVENPVLLVHVRAESRTLRSLFTFERSREPCLCSSFPDTLFTFERSWELFVMQAESRTLLYLFTFERSREPFLFGRRSREPCLCSSGVENPVLLVYVRAESRTFLLDRRSREPPFE